MMSQRLYLFIIATLLANEFVPVRPFVISTVLVISTITKAVKIAKQAYDLYNLVYPSTFPSDLQMNIETMQKSLDEIDKKMDELAKIQDEIIAYIHELPGIFQQILKVRALEKYITRLVRLHKLYSNYIANITKFENYTLLNFAETVVSHQPEESVLGTANQMHALIVPRNLREQQHSILRGVALSLAKTDYNDIGKLHQSPQQMLFSFYNYLFILRSQGNMMRYFSYTLLKVFGKGDQSTEVQAIDEGFENDVEAELKEVKKHAVRLSREYWRSDPDVHVENETYVELTNLWPMYIENRIHFRGHEHCPDECTGNTVLHDNYTYDEPLWKNQRKCNAKIYNCYHLSYRDHLSICMPKGNSHRRYHSFKKIELKYRHNNSWPNDTSQWVRHNPYGKRCPVNHTQLNLAEWRPGPGRWCAYCICRCEEREGIHSDRYVNLRPVLADFKNNRVVSSVRFTKHNQIIHLQVQEGELLPGGAINETTLRWVPVENYKIGDENIKKGRDYHTVIWKQRNIVFDTINAKKGDVIIGVRFITMRSFNELRFSILRSPFNVSSGKLTGEKHYWFHDTTRTLQPVWPFDDVGYYSKKKSVPSRHPSWTSFQSSNEGTDAAQSVVPTFDSQPVELPIPVALESMSIYHKGNSDSAGFIALKISHFNFIEHL